MYANLYNVYDTTGIIFSFKMTLNVFEKKQYLEQELSNNFGYKIEATPNFEQ